MIVQCDECEIDICSDCDGHEIEPNKYLCDDCMDDREEEEAVAAAANLPQDQGPRECGNCGVITRAWIEKNEGFRCVPCAHVQELKLLGGEHDAENCPICTPKKAA